MYSSPFVPHSNPSRNPGTTAHDGVARFPSPFAPPLAVQAKAAGPQTGNSPAAVPWAPDFRQATDLGNRNGYYYFGNVRWGYTALWLPTFKDNVRVPAAGVTEVQLAVSMFNRYFGAGHVALVFMFPPGKPITAPDGSSAQGLVISVEAARRVNQTYSLANGMFNHYKILYILTTKKSLIENTCHRWGNTLKFFTLDLSPEERDEMFELTVAAALRPRDESYNTAFNSCLTHVAQSLNQVVPPAAMPRSRRLGQILPALWTVVPTMTAPALRQVGLITKPPEVFGPRDNSSTTTG
jgi:hypothetical protein